MTKLTVVIEEDGLDGKITANLNIDGTSTPWECETVVFLSNEVRLHVRKVIEARNAEKQRPPNPRKFHAN